MATQVPEHAVVWFEIPVVDQERAKAFYSGSCPTEWCSWRMVAVHSGMAGLISAPWRAS